MAVPTIPNGKSQFFTSLYEGNGAGQKVGKFLPFTDNATIANSCIFATGDTASLTKTFGSAGDRTEWTWSAWIKKGIPDESGIIFYASPVADSWNSASSGGLYFTTDNKLYFYNAGTTLFTTNRTFEDSSKWYHLLVAYDSGQSGTDKIKFYVDGDQVTSFSTDNRSSAPANSVVNDALIHNICGQQTTSTANAFWDGYIAEVNFVDGTALTPSTFGITDTSTGRWIPKTLTGITYGGNGFRLTFADSSALGDDLSGNTNDFASANLASTDQTTASPSQNYATLNPNHKYSDNAGLTEGNLTMTQSSALGGACATLALPSSGKYYWEIKCTTTMDANTIVGIVPDTSVPAAGSYTFCGGQNQPNSYGFAPAQTSDAQTVNNGVWENLSALSKTTTADTVMQLCWDGSTGSLWFGMDNTFQGDPAAGTGASYTGINNTLKLFPACFAYADTYEFNFGQKSFAHTPPTSFVALQQDNLPESSKGVPGLVWIKNRDGTNAHTLQDSSRGSYQMLYSDSTSQEYTVVDGVQKFLKGGCSIEDDAAVNTDGHSYVSWNWVGNSASTSTNDASSTGVGTIDSTYQVNSTAGFSIVQYVGTGSAGTIKHGLSVAPSLIIVKDRDASTYEWMVYHKSAGATKYLQLSNSDALADLDTIWNDTEPTSTVFSIGTNGSVNTNTNDFIAYCFHSVEGFSKFGSYLGNGSTDGPFIYTGFKPSFLIFKSTAAANWYLFDGARNPYNLVSTALHPDTNQGDQEMTTRGVDFLSNGFKLRQETGYGGNNDGVTYIYMSIAEHSFNGDGTNPVTAR